MVSAGNTLAEALEELRQNLAVRLRNLVVWFLMLSGTAHFVGIDDEMSFSVIVGTLRLAQTAIVHVTLVTPGDTRMQTRRDHSRRTSKDPLHGRSSAQRG